MISPIEAKTMIISKYPHMTIKYKLTHILIRKGDKTWKFVRKYKYSYLKLWQLSYQLLRNGAVKYLDPTLFKDPFLNRNRTLYVYPYKVNNIYLKYIISLKNQEPILRSFHNTYTKDNRWRLIK